MCRPGENIEPHKVLGVSKEEFDQAVAEAESRGTIKCQNCGHVQYRKLQPWLCSLCYNTITIEEGRNEIQ